MRRRRVLVLTRSDLIPPDDVDALSDSEFMQIKTDYDVLSTLREIGHDVEVVGLEEGIEPLEDALREFRPHVVFNILEDLGGSQVNVAHVLGYLDLVGQAYTGCNPIGMLFATNKVLQRRLLRAHRIRTPDFALFRIGRAVKRPTRLGFPLIVKSATAHGSAGIARASVVDSDEKLAERVAFIHEQWHTDAVAEEFIAGREIYCAIMGNDRLTALPLIELTLENLPEGAPLIATERLKWNVKYQERMGLKVKVLKGREEELESKITRVCKRAYRSLRQSGYARMDLRVTDEGRVYVIESNPNPQLSVEDEFAIAAEESGLKYDAMLNRLISLGLSWSKRRESVT